MLKKTLKLSNKIYNNLLKIWFFLINMFFRLSLLAMVLHLKGFRWTEYWGSVKDPNWNSSEWSGMFSNKLKSIEKMQKSFQTIKKLFWQSGKCPQKLKIILICWKFPDTMTMSGNFHNNQESFKAIKKFRSSQTSQNSWPGNLPDNPESFQANWKFPDNPKDLKTILILSRKSKNIFRQLGKFSDTILH